MLKNSSKNLTFFHSLSFLPKIITKLLKTTSKQVKFGQMWTDSGLLYVFKAPYNHYHASSALCSRLCAKIKIAVEI